MTGWEQGLAGETTGTQENHGDFIVFPGRDAIH